MHAPLYGITAEIVSEPNELKQKGGNDRVTEVMVKKTNPHKTKTQKKPQQTKKKPITLSVGRAGYGVLLTVKHMVCGTAPTTFPVSPVPQ